MTPKGDSKSSRIPSELWLQALLFLGIGALPEYIGREAENLVEILPGVRGPSTDIYFVYPEELRKSKRIAVLRDFLVAKMGSDKF